MIYSINEISKELLIARANAKATQSMIADHEHNKHMERRYGPDSEGMLKSFYVGNKHGRYNPKEEGKFGGDDDDSIRRYAANDIALRERKRRSKDDNMKKIPDGVNRDLDAIESSINRNMRRHPNAFTSDRENAKNFVYRHTKQLDTKKSGVKESYLLTEEDADEFLESIGVALYEDFVTIGEHSIPSIEAEAILEEHGIFLYEEGIIIEGEQAKEYMNRNRLEPQARKISKELPAADIKLIPKKDKNRMDTFVKNIHMRRHPNQYKESCGIFSNIVFI